MVYLHELADSTAVGEQLAGSAFAKHRDLREVVVLLGAEQLSRRRLEPRQLEIRGTDGPYPGPALAPARKQAPGIDPADARPVLDERQSGRERTGIGDREPGGVPAGLLALVARWVGGVDDEIVDTHPLDHGEGLAPTALADRQHGDHGADAEHHAQEGERRAQPVVGQLGQGLTDVRQPVPGGLANLPRKHVTDIMRRRWICRPATVSRTTPAAARCIAATRCHPELPSGAATLTLSPASRPATTSTNVGLKRPNRTSLGADVLPSTT